MCRFRKNKKRKSGQSGGPKIVGPDSKHRALSALRHLGLDPEECTDCNQPKDES